MYTLYIYTHIDRHRHIYIDIHRQMSLSLYIEAGGSSEDVGTFSLSDRDMHIFGVLAYRWGGGGMLTFIA